MTGKLGFDFDEFGGNVDLMLIEGQAAELAKKPAVPALSDAPLLPVLDLNWTHLGEHGLSDWKTAAQQSSEAFATKVVYFVFGDGSGWMGYQLFDKGELVEDYSFGMNYDEDMKEMGQDPDAHRRPGTVVAIDDDDQQYLFWSSRRQLDASDIAGGEKFIDGFLRSEGAYLGWDLFPQT